MESFEIIAVGEPNSVFDRWVVVLTLLGGIVSSGKQRQKNLYLYLMQLMSVGRSNHWRKYLRVQYNDNPRTG